MEGTTENVLLSRISLRSENLSVYPYTRPRRISPRILTFSRILFSVATFAPQFSRSTKTAYLLNHSYPFFSGRRQNLTAGPGTAVPDEFRNAMRHVSAFLASAAAVFHTQSKKDNIRRFVSFRQESFSFRSRCPFPACRHSPPAQPEPCVPAFSFP